MHTAQEIIDRLALQPHPEGGHFRESYRSEQVIASQETPGKFPGGRSFATAVYFLLHGDDFSALHRIRSDEIWHFYQGSSLTICSIDPTGALWRDRLGSDIIAGERPQVVVRAGSWFGAFLHDSSSYALLGCTVAPGFDFRDFEMGRRDRLLSEFPHHADLIRRLTR